MQIQAALTRHKDARFSIETVELAAIEADEILVELAGTGICHTDLAIVHQQFPLPLPYVLGHEGAGTVVATGPDVRGLAPGDRVVLTFESCGGCGECATGHPAYCDHYAARNYGRVRTDGRAFVTDADGRPIAGRYLGQSSFATHVIATPRNAVKVDDDLPTPILCGLGCGFMTGASAVNNVDRLSSDSIVVVSGAGAVGFAAMFAALNRGCKRVVMVDRVAARLRLASELGASQVIDTAVDDLAVRLKALGGVDLAIDTTGVGPVIEQVVGAMNRLGRTILLGASASRQATIDMVGLIQGKTVGGQIFGDADPHTVIPELIAQYRAGRFPIDRLIRTYPFAQINEAAADAQSGVTIKPVLLF